MNFFDTTNKTFLNPVTGKTVHYKKMVIELGDSDICVTLKTDLGKGSFGPLFSEDVFSVCLGMNRKEGIKFMKEKMGGKILYVTPEIYDESLWDIAFLPGDLEIAMETIDKILTERYGKAENHVDRKHRLAGHVRLEFK